MRNSQVWFDVALLLLANDVPISPRVMPICISNKIFNSNLTKQAAEISGYGKPRNNPDAFPYQHLNSLAMTIIKHKDCRIVMRNVNYIRKQEINGNVICAISGEKNTGSSNGDSGGNSNYVSMVLWSFIAVQAVSGCNPKHCKISM